MLDSFRRGFGFLQQAAQMAVKDPDLLKPSVYAFLVGLVVTALLAIPSGLAFFLYNGNDLGILQLAGAILVALIAFLQYAVSYFFSGMTVRLVADYLSDGDGRMDLAWENARRDFFDILALAGASALVKLLEGLLRGKGKRRNPFGEMLAGALNALWTTATFFVLPAMILEDLNLPQALKRATMMIKDNLLLVAVTSIGVGGVVGLIGFGASFLAVAGGAAAVYAVGALTEWALAPLIAAGVIALIAVGAVLAVVSVLSSYVQTAYHTCLFVWAAGVEKARERGLADAAVAAPAPVAAVL